MFRQIKKALGIVKVDEDTSYMINNRDCHIEDTLDRNRLLITVRRIFHFRISSRVTLRNIDLNTSLLKLLSSGIKYSTVDILNITECVFSDISLVGLKNVFSHVNSLYIMSFEIKSLRQRKAFSIMMRDIENGMDKTKEQLINIFPKIHSFWGDRNKKDKNLIRMQLAGLERNYHKFTNWRVNFRISFAGYFMSEFVNKIFKENVYFFECTLLPLEKSSFKYRT